MSRIFDRQRCWVIFYTFPRQSPRYSEESLGRSEGPSEIKAAYTQASRCGLLLTILSFRKRDFAGTTGLLPVARHPPKAMPVLGETSGLVGTSSVHRRRSRTSDNLRSVLPSA